MEENNPYISKRNLKKGKLVFRINMYCIFFAQFNSSTQLNPDSPGFLAKPSTQDRMHALVIIVDSTNVEIFEHTILENIKIFQDKANQRGKKILIVLIIYLNTMSIHMCSQEF